MIDPTFRNINRFVQSFNVHANDNDGFFFNVHVNWQSTIFQATRKNKQEPHEKLVATSRNVAYTNDNLLDCSYHQSLLASIYQDTQIRVFLNKLIL